MLTIHVPTGMMPQLRELVQNDFMAAVHKHDGFVAAYLLEQEDDPNVATMIQVWETHDAIESFRRTGMLSDIHHKLHAFIPGLKTSASGQIVRIARHNLFDMKKLHSQAPAN